ncbi:MAG: hypothetical protein ACTSW1_06670 [Candidatus Hodarchaeales archaeon]
MSEKLIQFVDDVQDDLEFIVINFEMIKPERVDVHELIGKSWSEIKNSFHIGKEELSNLSEVQLSFWGLSGDSLDFKLAEYQYRRIQFKESPNFKPRNIRPRFWEKRLRRHLISIDTIFDTLSSAVPAFQVIKEFKETIISIFND